MSSGRLAVGAATMPPVSRWVRPLSTSTERATRSARGPVASSSPSHSTQPATVASRARSAFGAAGAMNHEGYQASVHAADPPSSSGVLPRWLSPSGLRSGPCTARASPPATTARKDSPAGSVCRDTHGVTSP